MSEKEVIKPPRSVKKLIQRILMYVLLSFLTLILVPVIALQFPPIQTWIVNVVSASLSDRLQTRVEVGSVNLAFFNRVLLNDVYIEDLDRNPMIEIGKLTAEIQKLPVFGQNLKVGNLILADGRFNLRTNENGANISALVAKLSKPKDPSDTTKAGIELETESVEIRNFKYTMLLHNALTVEEKPYGIIFQNMDIDSIYIKIKDIIIANDTIRFKINDLVLRERSGFVLEEMNVDSGYFALGKDLSLFGLNIRDRYSSLILNQFRMTYENGDKFKNFINNVYMDTDIQDSDLSFLTVGYFAPVFRTIAINARFRGHLFGTIANMKGQDIKISTMQGTHINGSFSMSGLPDIESTIIYAKLEQLKSSPTDVFNVLSAVTGRDHSGFILSFRPLQQINFSGTFTGLINDFVANGKLNSNLGKLNVDILMKSEGLTSNFKGKVIAEHLKLDQLLNSDILGLASFNMMVDGKFSPNSRNIYGKGVISSIIANNYNYENIQLGGRLINREFTGEVSIDDPNINLQFLGAVNLGTPAEPIPSFDFKADIKAIDLVELHFNTRDSISNFKGKIKADFKASSILDFIGDLSLSEAWYNDASGSIDLGYVKLTSNRVDEQNKLQFNSRFVDAQYIGQYNLSNLMTDLIHILYIYFPVLNDNPNASDAKKISTNKYQLHIQTKKSGDVMRIVHPQLYIAEKSKLDIYINGYSDFNINLISPKIGFKQQIAEQVNYTIKNIGNSFQANLKSSQTKFGGIQFKNFDLTNTGADNVIVTRVKFNDTAIRKSSADLSFTTKLIKAKDLLPRKVSIDFHESGFKLYGDDWHVDPFYIRIDSSRINIAGLNVYKDGQYIAASGTISHAMHDTLKVELFRYQLNNLNYISQPAGYKLDGDVSGMAELTSLYNSPHINLNFEASRVSVNSDTVGSIMVASNWDQEEKRLGIISRIYNDQEITSSINGFYVPESQTIQLDAQIKRLKLVYLNPLLKGILSDLKGKASGNLRLRGTLNEPNLSGKLNLNQIDMLVDYLKTPYKLDADINIESDRFVIKEGTITDNYGQKGRLNVLLKHDYFKNITFDAVASTVNLQCLNTHQKDNPLFYGSAYATGGIRLSGNPKEFNFDIVAQSEKKTLMFIPLPNSAEAKTVSFIKFKIHDSVKQNMPELPIPKEKSKVTLGMDLTVTPESEIQILIDEKVGDIIKARGQGNLKIKVNPSINLFDIVGDFRIEKGDYNFTVPNFSIISRKFIISPGSMISFKGDIVNAILDVKATYKERVSISNLVPIDSTSSYKRTPVICEIQITGKMTNPTLKFDLSFPDLEPEKRAIIQSLINTEEKLTRQFLALLVLKSFLPEQEAGSQAGMGSSALLGNATELLSGQIGELISMFNLPIPIDINVEYSENTGTTRGSEYDIDFSTQLFDRVILNGSAGSNRRSARNFVGDFEAEVLAGKKGNLRFKAFTKSHDYFSDDMESNRQGIGISYQGKFQKIRDIFRRKKKVVTDLLQD